MVQKTNCQNQTAQLNNNYEPNPAIYVNVNGKFNIRIHE